MKLAIIDLGTNSLRLDIHEIENDSEIELVHREKRMVRLGDGVFETGKFSKKIMKRGKEAFIDIKSILTEFNVDQVMAFATSAMRSAGNAKEFISMVEKDTGIKIQVLSGKQESQLIAEGILSNEKIPKKPFFMIDIGGGSTEITFCKEQAYVNGGSFRLGANRLQQTYLNEIPPPSEKNIKRLRQHIRKLIEGELKSWSSEPVKSVMGSSGTVRALNRIIKKSGGETQPFKRPELTKLIGKMSGMTKKQLADIPGLELRRVDLILSGAILLDEVLEIVGANKVYVTNFSLRDGIFENFLTQFKKT